MANMKTMCQAVRPMSKLPCRKSLKHVDDLAMKKPVHETCAKAAWCTGPGSPYDYSEKHLQCLVQKITKTASSNINHSDYWVPSKVIEANWHNNELNVTLGGNAFGTGKLQTGPQEHNDQNEAVHFDCSVHVPRIGVSGIPCGPESYMYMHSETSNSSSQHNTFYSACTCNAAEKNNTFLPGFHSFFGFAQNRQNYMNRHSVQTFLSQHRKFPSLLKAAVNASGCHSLYGLQSHRKAHSISSDEVPVVNTAEIKKFLSGHDMAFEQGHTCFITSCPRHITRRLKLREIDKLYVNMTTGYFVCHSCKKSGSWSKLQDNIAFLTCKLKEKKRRPAQCFAGLDDTCKDTEKAVKYWDQCTALQDVPEEIQDQLLIQHGIEKLQVEWLYKCNIRVTPGQDGLVLPAYRFDGTLHGIKILTHKTKEGPRGTVTRKLVVQTVPRLDYVYLFGWNTIKANQTEVILTSSEFDAIAIQQQTSVPAVALPRGDSVLPQQVLPLLEQFNKVTLWFGKDMRSWETAKQFSRKLNEKRCYVVRPSAEITSPLSSLIAGGSLPSLIKSAKPVVHKSIVSFRQLRFDVLAEFEEAEKLAGVKWKRYPQLNALLKGHRRGELTVFTGPTGSGKTTFISDYSLDLCLQGVNTLWGSFEINNVRLLKTMLRQFSQVNLMKNIESYDYWADKFEQLSMFFMTFYGQESVRNVIETMSHAVYVHDIAHVIVDNLQFMMGTSGMTAADRFLHQDQIISAFRKFATNMNCHVTLVIHPRKERETEDLSISSIFGSAKASQEADNILILQDKRLTSVRGRKYLQLAKNRFDGELGIMLLRFDKDTLSYAPKATAAKKPKPKTDTRTKEVLDNIVNAGHGQTDQGVLDEKSEADDADTKSDDVILQSGDVIDDVKLENISDAGHGHRDEHVQVEKGESDDADTKTDDVISKNGDVIDNVTTQNDDRSEIDEVDKEK